MKSRNEIFELALKAIPYSEGNVEDDIDAVKRNIWTAGFLACQEEYASHPSAVQAEALSIDMTAEEFFNHPDGMFTLDFLTEEERETLYKAIDLFAAGKVRNALGSKLPATSFISAPQDEGWVKNISQDGEQC